MCSKLIVPVSARRPLVGLVWAAAAIACAPVAAQGLSMQVGSRLGDSVRRVPSVATPAALATTNPFSEPAQDRGIIIVSGSPADRVALNPQPLPPKLARRRLADLTSPDAERGIIIVSGRHAHGDAARRAPTTATSVVAP